MTESYQNHLAICMLSTEWRTVASFLSFGVRNRECLKVIDLCPLMVHINTIYANTICQYGKTLNLNCVFFCEEVFFTHRSIAVNLAGFISSLH